MEMPSKPQRMQGAKRILYTSHQAANPISKVAFARDHAATEKLLEASGVDFVSLRNGFYAESSLYQFGGMQATGKLALPNDGHVSLDFSERSCGSCCRCLDGHNPVTRHYRSAHWIEDLHLRPHRAAVLRDSWPRNPLQTDPRRSYRQAALKRGFPEAMVGMLLSMFEAIHDGEFNVIDPTLERLLMRRPTEFEAILAPYLAEVDAPQSH